MDMHTQLSLLWTWNRVIHRVPYLLTGVLLFLVKYAIDWTIATHGFGLSWSPLNYLIWPNDRVLRMFELDGPERWFSLVMLVVSLPFIWTGVILTLHRLRANVIGLVLNEVHREISDTYYYYGYYGKYYKHYNTPETTG